MVGLTALWLPILLSAIAVFVVSSIIHMVTPWHKGDYPRLANEDAVRDALRPLAIPPGDYMIPRPLSQEDAASPAFDEKMRIGPNLVVTVMPNAPMNMGALLGQWFLYSVTVGAFAAYVAGRACGPGAPYLHVFRFVGVTAFLGYSAALPQMSIWYRRSWGNTFRAAVDGLLFALVSAGIFGWLWPAA